MNRPQSLRLGVMAISVLFLVAASALSVEKPPHKSTPKAAPKPKTPAAPKPKGAPAARPVTKSRGQAPKHAHTHHRHGTHYSWRYVSGRRTYTRSWMGPWHHRHFGSYSHARQFTGWLGRHHYQRVLTRSGNGWQVAYRHRHWSRSTFVR